MAKTRIEFLYDEDAYTMDDFKEYCKEYKSDFGYCPYDDDDYGFCEWESDMLEQDLECLLMNLKFSSVKNRNVVITGFVGTWMGTRDICADFNHDIKDAIMKCIDGCTIRSIKRVGNHLEIVVYHHDGANCFDIYFLSDIGADRWERNGSCSLNNRENIFKIPKYIF